MLNRNALAEPCRRNIVLFITVAGLVIGTLLLLTNRPG
jgi:hypothetical protein